MEREKILKELGQIKASIVPDKINQKFISKYYTIKGYKELEERLNAFIRLLVGQPTYPIKKTMLGFPILYIQSKEELIFRIKELCETLFISNIHLEEIKNDNKK